jgi:signal transduction histidine kinase
MVGAELRGPLDAIQVSSAALSDGGRLSGEQAKDLDLIRTGARELLGLIDAVLGISAREPGTPTLDLKLGEVDLVTLAREVARAQRPLVEKKRLKLLVEATGDVPPVRGDAQRLRQVLTNLVTNALKFSDKGKVTIEVRHDRERVLVAVRDQGPGIPASQVPRLFREFEQARGGTGAMRGTGLGLAICKQLVEAHGGTIGVESTPGAGSTFLVMLPVAGPPLAAPAPPPPPEELLTAREHRG